jgi:flagellar basal-body rod protein FlgB
MKLLLGKKIFDQTVDLLQRSLDIRTSRQKVLSSNVANVDTPDYLPKDLPFQKILDRFVNHPSRIPLVKTHALHFPEPANFFLSSDFTNEIEQDPQAEGVNIDQEMAKLAENNLMFQAGVQSLIKKLEALKTTITEGR